MDNLLISKKSKRKKHGGSLTLVVAIGLGIVLVVLFLAIVYSQQFAHQKEAQTAIDSATITVAKELARVTIADPNLGQVAVCDQFQNGGPQQSPIYGINTLVGRARLDAVIARQLNNQDMMLLVNRDAQHVTQAALSLRGALNQLQANDFRFTSQGQNIDLKQLAVNAYNSNPTRAQNSPNITRQNVEIQLGYVANTSAGLTDIPIPAPANMSLGADSESFSGSVDNKRFYRAGVSAQVPGVAGNYVFNAIGRQPKLVDRTAFTTTAPNPSLIPSVVRVTIHTSISSFDPTKQNGAVSVTANGATGGKIEVACATAGGNRVPTTAGIFRLEFPQGIPNDVQQGNYFRSIIALMNAPDNAWTGNANFFTAAGGPFPGGGQIQPANYPPSLTPGENSALNPRRAATPSEVVSYYVYDWLRNDCLRPNVQSVLNALGAPLRTAPSQIADAQKSIFTSAGELVIQKAYAQAANPQCNNIWGGIFALIPNSTLAMQAGSTDQRSLNNFSAATRNIYVDQSYIFRMQGSAPQQLAFAPGQTICIGLNEETGCPQTTDGQPIAEALDLREDMNATQNTALASYDAGANVQDDAYAALTPLLNRRNQLIAEINAINAQIFLIDNGPVPGVPGGLRSLTANDRRRPALVAARNQQLALRAPKDAENANVLEPAINEQNRRIARAAAVMNNCVEFVASVSGIPPYTAPAGFPGLWNNMKAVSALGLDRVVPADAASTARPRQYLLARTISFWPLETPATEAQIVGTGANSPTGQLPQALGDKNWLGNPRIFTGNRENIDANGDGVRESVETAPGRVAMINCPPNVRPSTQTRNIELITVGGADENGGQIQFTVSNVAPVNDNGRGPTIPGGVYNAALATNLRANVYGSAEAQTGVSALLRGNSQAQALNVYSVRSQCDRDPANGRFSVMWSMMAQNNVANLSSPDVDVRNEDTDGNRLDCGRAAQTGNAEERICDNEAVRIQFTSPLPYVPALPPSPPPAPPRNPVNIPPIPGTPPPPPPAPPPHSH